MKNYSTLLCVDTAYTMDVMQKTKRLAFCNGRHFLGVFQKVYAIHPLADVGSSMLERSIEFFRISKTQLIIEGAAFRYKWPSFLIPLNFAISQIRLLALVVRLVWTRKVDAIYATDPYYCGLFGMFVKIFTGRPLVVLVAGNYDEIYEATGTLAMPRLFRYRFVENAVAYMVLKNANLVAGGNKNNLECAIRHGANPNNSTIFTSGLLMDQSHFVPPESRSYERLQKVFPEGSVTSKQRHHLLFVGRLLDVKMPGDALKAMQIVMRDHHDVVGFIAGEGPLRRDLEDWVRSAGLSSQIRFLGNIDQELLSLLLPNSIVLSPLTGMALIEAGLGGAAIVAYDRDWQAEFITSGVNGYVVGFRDFESMAERAIELLNNSKTYGLFSEGIRQRSLAFISTDNLSIHFREQWARVIPSVQH